MVHIVDSPPEKDVQWSDSGVVSSNKFLQKLDLITQYTIDKKEINQNEKELFQY